MAQYVVAALYKFVSLPNFRQLQKPLHDLCSQHQVCGTLLLAAEGINGTIAGSESAINAVLQALQGMLPFKTLDYKLSWADKAPFYRLKIKLKREIVTMGVPGLDPATQAGQYVRPHDWNALIDRPETVVVDVRNNYEVAVGSFEGAVNPHTVSFTEFPEWVRQQAESGVLKKDTPVAMFCTGGIRCEKSTAYLRSQGFDEVYHLEGGILKYLETIQPDDSRWQGECFVFDERVTVGHGLEPGNYTLCRACRYPLSSHDMASEHYIEGLSCPHCHDQHDEDKKRRLAERQKQVMLARQRNQRHIGAQLPAASVSDKPGTGVPVAAQMPTDTPPKTPPSQQG